jgi:ABC-2 type transport system ATP-binding protein
MNVAQEICDRVGIINKGRLVACKPTDQLLELFSDLVFEIRLDRLPTLEDVGAIPGVRGVELSEGDAEPMLLVRVEEELSKRSEALYATMERLRARGFLLRSISQRQQTLENVFLRLTDSGGANNSETPDQKNISAPSRA